MNNTFEVVESDLVNLVENSFPNSEEYKYYSNILLALRLEKKYKGNVFIDTKPVLKHFESELPSAMPYSFLRSNYFPIKETILFYLSQKNLVVSN